MVTVVYDRIEWVQHSTAKPQMSKMLPVLGMRDSKLLCNKEWFSACVEGGNIMGILEQITSIALLINKVLEIDCNWLYLSVLCPVNNDTDHISS